MNEIKRMAIKDFRNEGYLHEVNRLVLHPLGLAMEVNLADETGVSVSMNLADFVEAKMALRAAIAVMLDGAPAKARLQRLLGLFEQHPTHYEAGDESLGGVWDDRDDPEGISYGDDLLSPEKAARIAALMLERRKGRAGALKYVVQPVGSEQPVLTTTYVDPAERSSGRP